MSEGDGRAIPLRVTLVSAMIRFYASAGLAPFLWPLVHYGTLLFTGSQLVIPSLLVSSLTRNDRK
jgi:hypothetical protein